MNHDEKKVLRECAEWLRWNADEIKRDYQPYLEGKMGRVQATEALHVHNMMLKAGVFERWADKLDGVNGGAA